MSKDDTFSWNEFKNIDFTTYDNRSLVQDILDPEPFSLHWWIELYGQFVYLDTGVITRYIFKNVDYTELSEYCYYRILKKLGKLNKNTK